MGRRIMAIALAAVVAGAGTAMAATATAQKCEAGKQDASGKYLACLGKAEKILTLIGNIDAYNAMLAKCESKLLATWQKLEATAAAAGGSCPSTGDAATVQTFLDGCMAGLAQGVSGGTLPPDGVACNADLVACNADLGTCAAGLGACQSDCVASVRPPLRTGETTSYGTGSDGNVQSGAARSFTDNGDGTISDHTTGLMWEKKDESGGIHDKDNVYTWSTGSNAMDGMMVSTFLAMLNGGGGFAGHTDWRVPNLSELESIRNLDAMNPSAHSVFNDACVGSCNVLTCSCTRWYYYWSSSTYKAYPSNAWIVNFSSGATGAGNKTDGLGVRAVRGSP